MATLCEKCLHSEVCSIRDCHEDGDEQALTFCSDFKMESVIAMKVISEIEERIAVHTFTSKSEDYADGMYDAVAWVDSKIDELKKKYTEGET